MNLLARSACKERRTELSFKCLYNLDPLSSLCFKTFFISGTQSQSYWGGSPPPPHFSNGKLFLFISIRHIL